MPFCYLSFHTKVNNMNKEFYFLGYKHHVVHWKSTDILEEHATSIFRAEE
jgi:hypothetical protein